MDHLFNFAGVIWLLRGLLYMKQLGVLEIISKSSKFCSHLEAGTPCKCLCKMLISFTCKVAFNQLIPWLVICFFKMRNSGL